MADAITTPYRATLTLPTNERPTFWNKDALLGFLIFFIPGMLIGGFIGKHRMERDLVQGKEVKPPHLFNKDAAIGALLGLTLVSCLAFTIPFSALFISSAIAAVAGGFIGGKHGEQQMAKEYAAAQQFAQQKNMSQGVSPVRANQIAPGSPDLHDMARTDGKPWTQVTPQADGPAKGSVPTH